jgi:Family of unknown function (DUF6308)
MVRTIQLMALSRGDKDIKGLLRRQLGLSPETGAPLSSAAAADLVKPYVSSGGEYTGRAFDVYGRNDPFAITSDDLIAVTMLSISIREKSNSALQPSAILGLQTHSDQIESLLQQLPPTRELHTLNAEEFESWLGPNSPGTELYDLLRQRISFPASRHISCWPASASSCCRFGTPSSNGRSSWATEMTTGGDHGGSH